MIDVIDTALLAQNDAGGMAVFNELALAMTGGGEGALESVLRGHAADRGDGLTLGQLLRDALHGGASLGSMATLEVLGGLRAVDSGGGGGELATMSFFYSDGDDGGGESDDVDGDGQPDEPIPVTGKRPNDVDEDDDDGGWLPPPGGGGGGDDSGGDGPGGGGQIGDDSTEPDCAKTNKVAGTTPPDNAKYFIPESVSEGFLVSALNHVSSFNDLNRPGIAAEIVNMYTDPSHPFFVDFKDWGTSRGPAGSVDGGTMTYYSPAAGSFVTGSVFEPFGNYFFGILCVFAGLSPEEIMAAAAIYSETGWGDDPQDIPHVEKGIADAAAFIDGGKTMFTIVVTNCSSEDSGS